MHCSCDVCALGKTGFVSRALLLLLQMARSYCYLGLHMWENGIARSWEVTIFNVAGECGKPLTLTGQILLLLLMLSGTSDETCRWNVLLIVRRGVRALPHGLYNSTHSQFTSPALQQHLRQVYGDYRNVVILLEKYRGSIKFSRQVCWDNGTIEKKTLKLNCKYKFRIEFLLLVFSFLLPDFKF